MRIFIGIKLGDSVIGNIEKFLKPFKKISSPIRWVTSRNIHITLKFIGEVSTEKCSRIERALMDAAAAFNPGTFNVTLAGCGTFGKTGTLNIFWIGIAPGEPLAVLFEKIEDALEKIGIKKEDRPFKPHITVGRNKKNFNFKSFFKMIAENKEHRIAEFPVTHFQLFKSRLTPEGPVYTIIKEIPLAEA